MNSNGNDYYETMWRTNAIGTRHILTLQRDYRFKLVFFSSSEIYGDFNGIMQEQVPVYSPIYQLNDYAMSKWVNEQQILNMSAQHNLETVRVRLFNTYGPGEYYTPYRSVISQFCYYAIHGLPYTVYKGHKRSFSYIDDTVRTLANIADLFYPGEVYNIGSDRQYTIEDVSKMIHEATGTNTMFGGFGVRYAEKEELTTTEKQVSLEKAKKDLGHVTTVELEEGIRYTVSWMREVYGK
jgi:dTDP-glucose 4,6-dehydratase